MGIYRCYILKGRGEGAHIGYLKRLWEKLGYAPSVPRGSLRKYLAWKHDRYVRVSIVDYNRRVIGTSAAMFVPFITSMPRWGILKGAWGFDTLIDTRHSQGSIFSLSRVYKKILSSLSEGRTDIALCFSTEAAAETYAKIGWTEAKNTFLFLKPLTKQFITYFLRKNRANFLPKRHRVMLNSCKDREDSFSCRFTLERIRAFDRRIDSLCAHISCKYGLVIARDRHYLNWRFTSCPTQKYAMYLVWDAHGIAGYMVLREDTKGYPHKGYLVDIFGDPDNRILFRYMVSKAMEIFKNGNMDLLHCISSHSGLQRILLEYGFIVEKRRRLFVIAKEKALLDAVMRGNRHWFITFNEGELEG